MEVAWPGRRADVLAALKYLATEPPLLAADGRDTGWPNLTNAVHWLVDDTFWDQHDAVEEIGTILRGPEEAAAVNELVGVVVGIAERHGATAPDARWFGDPEWERVRSLAATASELLRR